MVPVVDLSRRLQRLHAAFAAAAERTLTSGHVLLGSETEAKWTMRIAPNGCEVRLGKAEGLTADCVLKTTPEIFTKIVREAYTPSPMEFMTGAVKSNDIALLQTFQKVFDLG